MTQRTTQHARLQALLRRDCGVKIVVEIHDHSGANVETTAPLEAEALIWQVELPATLSRAQKLDTIRGVVHGQVMVALASALGPDAPSATPPDSDKTG